MRYGVRESFKFAVCRRKFRGPFRNLLLQDRSALLDFVEHFVERLGQECHFVTAFRNFGANGVVSFSRYHTRNFGEVFQGRMIDPRIAEVASKAMTKQTSRMPAENSPNCPAL